MEKRKSFLNQKGFSLVELIIVIAIMAILVAVMVPVLMKWIEKSNVSSDTQLADTVRGAFLCAITDARVLADSASNPYFGYMEDGSSTIKDSNLGMKITELNSSGCVMEESVEEILGMQVWEVNKHLKSKHENDSELWVMLKGGNVIVTITKTDSSGKKVTNAGRNIVVD